MPDRTEWSLQGQFLAITLPITDPVSDHTHFLYMHLLTWLMQGLFFKSNCHGCRFPSVHIIAHVSKFSQCINSVILPCLLAEFMENVTRALLQYDLV